MNTLNDFRSWLKSQISLLESLPQRGAEIPDCTYKVETPQTKIDRVAVFDETPDDWEHFASIINKASTLAAKFGAHDLFPNCPPVLNSRRDTVWQLKRVSAWCDGQAKQADFLTVGQAADRLQVSKDSIYDLIQQGNLEHTKVGRTIRIKPSALDHIHQPDGW